MFLSEIPVYVAHLHLSPRNLIDGVHNRQTMLISPRSSSLRHGGDAGHQDGGSVRPLKKE